MWLQSYNKKRNQQKKDKKMETYKIFSYLCQRNKADKVNPPLL